MKIETGRTGRKEGGQADDDGEDDGDSGDHVRNCVMLKKLIIKNSEEEPRTG